jgi:hypothetical protein
MNFNIKALALASAILWGLVMLLDRHRLAMHCGSVQILQVAPLPY